MDRFIIGPRPRTVISYFLEESAAAGPPVAAAAEPPTVRVEEREVPPLAPRIAVDIFCDGACVNNGRRGARAAFGMMARRGASELFVAAEPLRADEPQTNQRAELRGLAAAVTYALTAVSAGATTIRIYSDSEYSINCVTKWVGAWRRAGWRKADGAPVLHRDILEPLCDKWDSLRGVAFLTHVAAHTGRRDPISLGNERADELARAALASTHGFF
jgi:ribonuclease HI